MCGTCGCSVTPEHRAETGRASEQHAAGTVLVDLLAANDRVAGRNRDHLDRHSVRCVNLMSSPGAGKTTLLESTLDALAGRYRMAVIEGDLETENDASRIRARGVPAIQITTGTACHLDAPMIHEALHALDLDALDLLFIENVGNLVCPASFDLGQHHDVVLLSVPEGDDKPAKYPVMFRAADLVLMTKADFLPLSPEFAPGRVATALREIGNDAPVIELSARTGAGLDAWIDWLDRRCADAPEVRGHGRPAGMGARCP